MLRFLILVATFATLSLLAGETPDQNKIVFLYLRMKDGAVTLERIAIVPGTLKKQRGESAPSEIAYEARDANGSTAVKGGLRDPSVQRYSYTDPGARQMKTKIVQQDDVEFVVRLPWRGDLKELEFYKQSTPAGGTRTLNKKSIGKVSLNLEGGAK